MAAINEVIDLSIEDGIAVITSNHPPVNALSAVVRDGLTAAFDQALCDPAVKAIVLTCAGRTFFAGADIGEFGKPHKGAPLQAVLERIDAARKPVEADVRFEREAADARPTPAAQETPDEGEAEFRPAPDDRVEMT